MHRFPAALVVLMSSVVVAAGCGGADKDIDAVGACLEKLGMTVEPAPKTDKSVEKAVFATSGLQTIAADGSSAAKAGAEKGESFTFALAATVTDEAAIDTFQRESSEFIKRLDEEDRLEVETGTDGNYAWVAGGEKGSAAFDEVRDCVEA